MPSPARRDTTQLLARVRAGERKAFDLLYARLYEELHAIARRQVRKRGSKETLNPTAVVHEVYLRLLSEAPVASENRAHFLAIAARAMRRVIVDYARERGALKRGGGVAHLSWRPEHVAVEREIDTLIAIDGALRALAEFNERLERVAECRLFGGLTQEETARALHISPRTVQRDWPRARAWLQQQLEA